MSGNEEGVRRLAAALAAATRPMTLFEAMAASKLTGWDAGAALKEMVRAGTAEQVIDSGATSYRLISAPQTPAASRPR